MVAGEDSEGVRSLAELVLDGGWERGDAGVGQQRGVSTAQRIQQTGAVDGAGSGWRHRPGSPDKD